MEGKDSTKGAKAMRKEQPGSASIPEHIAAVSAEGAGRVSAADRWAVRRLLESVGSPAVVVVLWDGESIGLHPGTPVARLRIGDRAALYKLITYPGLHFGDLYAEGRLEVEGDLLAFLEAVYRGMRPSAENRWTRVLESVVHRPRQNSLNGSRENIHSHYDIGNEFYALWLDREAMQYTCAYFPEPDMELEAAQIAKLHHVCRKLRLQPGETVVEAGCGWGGLARFMARHYGVRVKAFNISHEQVVFARERARQEGLEGRVEYIEDDYRNIEGRYDAFVSVGMLEHVGPEHYRELGGVISRCLQPHGRGLIHSIGRNSPGEMNAWIERRIFPGARPPALSEMMQIFEPYELSVQDVENLRLHYAKTLQHWLARYEANLQRVREMFDEGFVRAWRLYLTGSIASFTTGALQLFQVVFTPPELNALPWSRAHLYEEH